MIPDSTDQFQKFICNLDFYGALMIDGVIFKISIWYILFLNFILSWSNKHEFYS